MIKQIIIAIDGHSSTGKSTLAKMLSEHLDYVHINTGAMYRAVTLNAIRNNWIDVSLKKIKSEKNIIDSVDSLSFSFRRDQTNRYKIYMNNQDIEGDLKDPLVAEYVSVISTYPLLRQKIVKKQQLMGQSKGVVMEGRDIGSVVFPGAELKLFITASVNVRAERRFQELLNLGITVEFQDVLANLKKRDFSDSNRKDSPLMKVSDAVLIDNTFLNINQQFEYVLQLLENKCKIF